MVMCDFSVNIMNILHIQNHLFSVEMLYSNLCREYLRCSSHKLLNTRQISYNDIVLLPSPKVPTFPFLKK